MDVETKIKDRIADLELSRERYIIEAQKQVHAFDAAIGELRALLEQPTTPPEAEIDNGE